MPGLSMDSDRQSILAFISSSYPKAEEIGADTELVRSEIIDSYGIVQMIQFLEERFAIRFPDEEIIPDNFRTAAAIAECVQRIKGQA